MKTKLIYLIIIFILLCALSSNADLYYIIEKPSSLIIYNQYESRVQDESTFLPFAPFKIINKNDLLGDGISEVMKIDYLGKIFYLLKNDNGKLEGINSVGVVKKINAKSLDLKLSSSGNKTVKSGGYPGRKTITSKFGKNATAILKYNNYYYLIDSNKSLLGWSKANYWSVVKNKSKSNIQKKISADYVEKLTDKITTVNNLYKKTFDHFNKSLNDSKGAPYWKMERDGDNLIFKLRGSKAVVHNLEESTQYIVQDFMNILLGEPFNVMYNAGQITIVQEEAL